MPTKTIPAPPEGYEVLKLGPGDAAPEGCLVFADKHTGWERNYWSTRHDWFYAAKKESGEEAWDTSRFQRDNVMADEIPARVVPALPATHILYTGPKQWQKLPPGSLFWHSSGKWDDKDLGSVTAIPGDHNHYAIPLNVSLPENHTPNPVCEPDILEEARDLIRGDRASSYGDAKASFERIASLWTTYKGVEITAKDVASMMILLKVSRGVTSAKRDNWLDIIGYAALGSELE